MSTLPTYAAVTAARDALLALLLAADPYTDLRAIFFGAYNERLRTLPLDRFVESAGDTPGEMPGLTMLISADGTQGLGWREDARLAPDAWAAWPSLAPHAAALTDYIGAGGLLHPHDADMRRMYAEAEPAENLEALTI
jgi:hypothetical protein